MKFTLNNITYIVKFHYVTPLGRNEYDVVYHSMMFKQATQRMSNKTTDSTILDDRICFDNKILQYGQGVTRCRIKAYKNTNIKSESYFCVGSFSVNRPNETYSRQQGRSFAFEKAIDTFIAENNFSLNATDKKALKSKFNAEYKIQYGN